jgi:acyl carrier protein
MTTLKLKLPDAIDMLAEAFDEPAESIRPDRSRESIAGWDSMGALLLIAEIEERFGVELSAEDSRAMTQIADVLEFLRRHDLLEE